MGRFSILCAFLILTIVGVAHAEVCAGCPKTADPNDSDIRNILLRGVALQNAKSNEEDITVISINKVTSQIVAGVKYTYDFLGEGQKSKKHFSCRSVLLRQPWITPEPQILDYKCNPKKSKRDIGAPKDVSSEEIDQMRNLVQMGIETLDELDADDNKRVILKIIDAKKQLVNGILYHVTVKVKTTSCPEDGIATIECLEEEVGPQKICKLQIYRSFADKAPHNAKIVKSECDSAVKERSVDERMSMEHLDRASQFAAKMINNAMNSITIKGLVNVLESDTKYSSDSHQTSLILELADTNCTKQRPVKDSECLLIPHFKNHMICTVNVKHDEKSERMSLGGSGGLGGIRCENVETAKSLSNRARRALVGGEKPLSIYSDSIGELKKYISSVMSNQPGVVYTKRVSSVISASYQVLSGRVVRLYVEIADTNCLKHANYERECSLQKQGRVVCRMSIWEKPWLNSKEVISNECSSIQPVAELLGVEEDDANFQKFVLFTKQYQRSYHTVKDLNKRFKIFRANLKKADYLQKTEQGSATYGVTMFSDLSSAEFKKNLLGLKKQANSEIKFPRSEAKIPDITLPDEYDWRNYNVVTPVKNQGMCGSCWAFSVVGNIESLYAIKTGQLLSLSEQELVDCDKLDEGCNGGFFDTAYHAIEELGGLEGESDYPYTGYDGKCRFNSSEVKVDISNAVNISHNETDMAKWLVGNGPISIALNANAMQFYLGGVSHPLKFLCSPSDLDHGVLLVGYGVHKTWLLHRQLPYWLIKNSWGPHWGHSGYYMLYRGDGSCGVNQSPTSAVL